MFGRWFVVANQKNVKVLTERSDSKGRFKELKKFDNPFGRARNHEEFIKKQDPREQAAVEFAKNITLYLESARQKNKFETLTVVAEPYFLGKIRTAMKPQLKKLVIIWIKKDLQKYPKLKLTKFLLQAKG